MDKAVGYANGVLADVRYHDVLRLIKSARNGAVYGAKVRFPHAFVMVFLFRSGSFRTKLQMIIKATKQHARNLATFAFLYKLTLIGLLRAQGPGRRKEESWHTFAAGLVGGYAVFGRGMQSSVNQQIVVYVFARVVLALAKLSVHGSSRNVDGTVDVRDRVRANAWPVFASLSWAGVMWLFRWHPDMLQPSLKSSMKYIYEDSDHWDGIRNFIWHNK